MIGAKDVIAEQNPPLMMSVGKGKSKNIICVLKPSNTLVLFVSIPKKKPYPSPRFKSVMPWGR